MEVKQFQGINKYRDGTVTNWYMNTIPMGDSILDRPGEDLIQDLGTRKYVAHHVDAYGIYWVFLDSKLYKFLNGIMNAPILINDWSLTLNNVHFAESPVLDVVNEQTTSKLYMVVNGALWRIKTRDPDYKLEMINIDNDREEDPEKPGELTPRWSEHHKYIDICIYDNRICLLESQENKMWVSNAGEETWMSFSNYISGSDADDINRICSYGGSLFMFCKRSIEVWQKTGIDTDPLKETTNNQIMVGALDFLIANGILYILTVNQDGIRQVQTANPTGQLQLVSNPEIDRHIQSASELRPMCFRQSSGVCVYGIDCWNYRNTETYGKRLCCINGMWFELNDENMDDFLYLTIGDNYAFTHMGKIIRITTPYPTNPTYKEHRRNWEGRSIARSFQIGIMSFPQRQILRQVTVVMDTGVWFETREPRPTMNDWRGKSGNQLELRVSTDLALHWPTFISRELGLPGDNQKQMVFHNLGSGKDFTINIRTSANTRFQIFNLYIEFQ